MPILAVLHVLVAIFFAVHAVRTGRNNYWLFILLAFPFLGSVVYFFAEFLPEFRHTRAGRRAVGTLTSLIDPQRELRQAQADFERTPTVEHRARLADVLLANGQAAQAVEHYWQCASGPYAKDAKFRTGLARALHAAGRHAEAAATLRALFAEQPERRSGEPVLLLAQALAEVNAGEAIEAFDAAIELHNTTESRCAYALYLLRIGREARAKPLFEHVLRDARLSNQHARDMNQRWIDQARAALKSIEQRAPAP